MTILKQPALALGCRCRPQGTRVARKDEEAPIDNVIRSFRPHWRVLLATMSWAVIAMALIAAAVITTDGNLRLALAGAIVVALVFVTGRDLVDYFSTTYTLTTDQVIVKHGVLKITKVKIPLESIDNITMTRNLLERMLGYGDMVIESTQGSIPFTDIPDPEEFEAELLVYRDKRRGQPAATAATAAAAAAGRDPLQRLAELADLHERGALSDAEFEDAKQRLLGEI
ncbi:MAG: putative membrane protein YdbT with pleckstrin-like domain [Glaciecola sp.]|jgi:uncharacterized membrane protein YdbT with pleckstrin-like domain